MTTVNLYPFFAGSLRRTTPGLEIEASELMDAATSSHLPVRGVLSRACGYLMTRLNRRVWLYLATLRPLSAYRMFALAGDIADLALEFGRDCEDPFRDVLRLQLLERRIARAAETSTPPVAAEAARARPLARAMVEAALQETLG